MDIQLFTLVLLPTLCVGTQTQNATVIPALDAGIQNSLFSCADI